MKELCFNCPGSVIWFSAWYEKLSSIRAFHFVLAHKRHSLLSFFEKTSDVESGPRSYYTDNYLVQFDECHFLMASLGEKSCNDVVQLTSRLSQSVISVTQLRWAPLDVSLQTDLTEGRSSWGRSDPQKRVKRRQRRGQLQGSVLLSLPANVVQAYKAAEDWSSELLRCFYAVLCSIFCLSSPLKYRSVYCNTSADMKLINSKNKW